MYERNLKHYYRHPSDLEVFAGKYGNKAFHVCLECEKIKRDPVYTARNDAHYEDLLHHYTNPSEESLLVGN